MLDAFHIVKLAGDAPGEVRRRVQQDTTGHRGRKGDPLYPGPQSFARLTHAGSPHVNKNDSVRPSWQMRRISVSTSPTTAPSKCATSSIKPPPPKADAWPHTSSSAYQPVPSPKSLAWVEPYASGRTHSTPTSTPAEPATGQQKPSTESSSWEDAPPEAAAIPPTTDSAGSSSPQAHARLTKCQQHQPKPTHDTAQAQLSSPTPN